MALQDEIFSRFSAAQARKLTNPDAPAASTPDTGRLALAAADVEGDFVTYTGASYDNSNAQHVSVAVDGVEAKLEMRGVASAASGEKKHDAYLTRLRALRGVGEPQTDSPLTSANLTDEDSSDKPWSHDSAFADFMPGD